MKACPHCDASLPGIDGLCLEHRGETAKELLAALSSTTCAACTQAIGAPARDLGVPGLSECPACKPSRSAIAKARRRQ